MAAPAVAGGDHRDGDCGRERQTKGGRLAQEAIDSHADRCGEHVGGASMADSYSSAQRWAGRTSVALNAAARRGSSIQGHGPGGYPSRPAATCEQIARSSLVDVGLLCEVPASLAAEA